MSLNSVYCSQKESVLLLLQLMLLLPNSPGAGSWAGYPPSVSVGSFWFIFDRYTRSPPCAVPFSRGIQKSSGIQLRLGLSLWYFVKHLTIFLRYSRKCVPDEGYGRAENSHAKTAVQGVGSPDSPEDRASFLTVCNRRYCCTVPQVS